VPKKRCLLLFSIIVVLAGSRSPCYRIRIKYQIMDNLLMQGASNLLMDTLSPSFVVGACTALEQLHIPKTKKTWRMITFSLSKCETKRIEFDREELILYLESSRGEKTAIDRHGRKKDRLKDMLIEKQNACKFLLLSATSPSSEDSVPPVWKRKSSRTMKTLEASTSREQNKDSAEKGLSPTYDKDSSAEKGLSPTYDATPPAFSQNYTSLTDAEREEREKKARYAGERKNGDNSYTSSAQPSSRNLEDLGAEHFPTIECKMGKQKSSSSSSKDILFSPPQKDMLSKKSEGDRTGKCMTTVGRPLYCAKGLKDDKVYEDIVQQCGTMLCGVEETEAVVEVGGGHTTVATANQKEPFIELMIPDRSGGKGKVHDISIDDEDEDEGIARSSSDRRRPLHEVLQTNWGASLQQGFTHAFQSASSLVIPLTSSFSSPFTEKTKTKTKTVLEKKTPSARGEIEDDDGRKGQRRGREEGGGHTLDGGLATTYKGVERPDIGIKQDPKKLQREKDVEEEVDYIYGTNFIEREEGITIVKQGKKSQKRMRKKKNDAFLQAGRTKRGLSEKYVQGQYVMPFLRNDYFLSADQALIKKRKEDEMTNQTLYPSAASSAPAGTGHVKEEEKQHHEHGKNVPMAGGEAMKFTEVDSRAPGIYTESQPNKALREERSPKQVAFNTTKPFVPLLGPINSKLQIIRLEVPMKWTMRIDKWKYHMNQMLTDPFPKLEGQGGPITSTCSALVKVKIAVYPGDDEYSYVVDVFPTVENLVTEVSQLEFIHTGFQRWYLDPFLQELFEENACSSIASQLRKGTVTQRVSECLEHMHRVMESVRAKFPNLYQFPNGKELVDALFRLTTEQIKALDADYMDQLNGLLSKNTEADALTV